MGRLETVLTVGRMVAGSNIMISGSTNAAYSLNPTGNAQCKDGIAFFRIASNSEPLPKFSHFSVYCTTDYTLINRRRFRMASSQQIPFRIIRREGAGNELVMGLSQITENWGYHGSYAQESSE